MTKKISVVIVTFYREQFVRRTLLSCLAQRDVDFDAVEVIAVDGSPEATARDVVAEIQALAQPLGLAVRYVHEPRPGISHSRNAGILASAADLVAFIDDDEEADPHWLTRMLECQSRHHADIVLGPVYPMFELDRASRDPFWHWYFTADLRQSSGEIAKRGGGTHNCLILKRTCCPTDQPFDPALGLTGGEDTRFFQAVAQRGGRVIWCADGIIREFVPASRLRWRYALRRRLRENQLLLQSFLWSHPPNLVGIIAWMGVGLFQIILYVPLSLAFATFDRSTAMKCATKVAGGVGKLLWLPGMTLIGYGDRNAVQSEAGA